MADETYPLQPHINPEQLSPPAELCAQSTVRSSTIRVVSLGGGIESRYLGDDVVSRSGAVGVLRIDSVTKAIREAFVQGELISTLLSEDEGEARVRAEEVAASWGAAVVAHAAELGLAEDHPRFEDKDGWTIFKDEQNQAASPLLVVCETVDDQAHKRVVRLDALNERDPEFLQGQIKYIHEALATADLGDLIRANFATHDPTFLDMLPDFLRQLYETPEAEREAVAESMLGFLERMIAARGDTEGKAWQIVRELSRTHQALFHRKVCEASPEENRAQDSLALQFAMHFEAAAIEPLNLLDNWQRFLSAPHKFMPKYAKAQLMSLQQELDRLPSHDDALEDRMVIIGQKQRLQNDANTLAYYLETGCGMSTEAQEWLADLDMPEGEADELLFTAMFYTLLLHLQEGGAASRDGRATTVQLPAYRSLLRRFLADKDGQLSPLRQRMLDRPLPVVPPSPHPSPDAWEPTGESDLK